MLKKITDYQSEFTKETKQVIGQTNVLLKGSPLYCRLKECNFGNFLTDAYVYYVSNTFYNNIM